MNQSNQRNRFWRAEFVHRDGYTAPVFFVETSEREYDKARKKAIKMAKDYSRLGDFPKVWHVSISDVSED